MFPRCLSFSFVYLEYRMLTTILQSVTKSCISHLPGTNMATPQIAKQPYKISKHLCKYLPRSLKNAFLLLKRHDSRFGMLMNGCKKANQFFAICYKIPCLVSAIIVVNLSLWYFFSNLECCLWSKIVAFLSHNTMLPISISKVIKIFWGSSFQLIGLSIKR